jgi:PAS domain S-box-containing protein
VIIGYVGTITDITERKIAERKLRESEEKYRLLMEHSGAGVGFYDTDGILLYFNSRAAQALNGAPEDFFGKSIGELFGKDQAEVYVQRIRTAAQTGTPEEYEDHVSMPGGARWFLSSYARVLDANGAVIGVQIVSQDITSRKQAELAVRQSEREIRMLYETMRDGFVSTDMQGHILHCNNAYGDLLGYTRDELSRLSYQDLTPPEWRHVDEAMIREQVIARGYSDVYEKEYKTRSGRVVPVELRVLLLRNEAGQPAGMWAVVREITERKRIEEALRDSQQATEAILNSLTSHIAVVDQTGTIIAVNDAWMRFAAEEGIEDTAAVGLGADYFEVCRKAVANDRDEIARSALQGITEVISNTASHFYIEYPCHAPGEQRWFTMHVSRITGERTGVVIAHENITERKLAELRIQELADQLRRFSSHLEAAREEERIHIAREIHDELGQALTALKMDLTDIHRHTGALPDKVNERLGIMGSLIDRTAQTVQRLAGELRPPMLDELGLVAALGWYIQDFEERFSIACTRVRFDDPPPSDRTRATALYRVLQECLTNVARHAGATEVEIRLEYADATIVLEVRDNGRGITNDEMKKLNSHGILGMHERLQGYDGTLHVQGSQGGGTTVRACMPWPTR